MPLTDFQTEFLRNCSHRWNVKTGATRSGKTYLDCVATIPQRVLACRGEGLIVLLGNTRGTIERNVLNPMRDIWGAELVGNIRSDNTLSLFGKSAYVLGADNKKRVEKIQGAAIEYCYGDEITTWDKGVFDMLKSRLSCKHSHFDGTCNPDAPTHWFKQFLDSGADIYCQPYTIDDNPTLPSEFVAALKAEYAGTVLYNRFILGQWAAAEGVIYRTFADSIATNDHRFDWKPTEDERKPKIMRIHIGVDFGGNGSKHAFVAVGVLPGYRGVVGLMSQRVEARGSDAEHLCRAFADFVAAVFGEWGEIHAVYCDSAEQVLIQSLRNHLVRTQWGWLAERIWNSRKAPILDRIRLTGALMASGRFWVLPTAKTLTDALAAALWADNKRTEDTRLDDGTTDIDTLDAFEYCIERDYKKYLPR